MKIATIVTVFGILVGLLAVNALAQWTSAPGNHEVNGDQVVKGSQTVGGSQTVAGSQTVTGTISGPVSATTLAASGAATLNGNTTIGNATTDVAVAYIVEMGSGTNGLIAYQIYASNGVLRVR